MSDMSDENFGEFYQKQPKMSKLANQQFKENEQKERRESSAFSQEVNLQQEGEELDMIGVESKQTSYFDHRIDSGSQNSTTSNWEINQEDLNKSDEKLPNLSQNQYQNSPNQIEEMKNEYTVQKDQIMAQPQFINGIPQNQEFENILRESTANQDINHQSGEICGISHFLSSPRTYDLLNQSSSQSHSLTLNSQTSQQQTSTNSSYQLHNATSSERSTPQRSDLQSALNQSPNSTLIPTNFNQQNSPSALTAFQQNSALNQENSNQSASRLQSVSSSLGSYLGDLWEFDCIKLKYFKHRLTGDLVDLLQRSNHTAVYYGPKNSIYVFGGGGGDRVRFNDTLVLELPALSEEDKLAQDPASMLKIRRNSQFANQQRITKVSLFEVKGTLVPEPRTYHAACLLDQFMIVSAGEVNGQDSQDLWALNLESGFWFKVAVDNPSRFERKRFHTISALSQNRVVSFGGCHDNYLHLNEVAIFYMENFVKNQGEVRIERIKTSSETPSTRWGHAAAVHEDQLYICGGRSEIDISDLHLFDVNKEKWSQIKLGQIMPKPRRRHSVVFVGSTLLMFGGFDGEFYQDLHMLDLSEDFQPGVIKEHMQKTKTTNLSQDYADLVDQEQFSDIKFVLDSESQNCEHQQVAFANKSLTLYRLYEREIRSSSFSQSLKNLKMEEVLTDQNHRSWCPEFIKQVFDAPTKSSINLPKIYNKQDFLTFLTFCYTEKVIESISGEQIGNVMEICKILGLPSTANHFQKLQTFVRQKIELEVLKKFSPLSGNGAQNLRPEEVYKKFSPEQAQLFFNKVQTLMAQVKFSFDELDESTNKQEQCLSPEDYCSKNQYESHLVSSEMSKCRNLDVFYDIVFELEDESLIRANSAVLQARSDYFRAMFSQKSQFGEYQVVQTPQNMSDSSSLRFSATNRSVSLRQIRHVKIHGIEKQHFCAIIQFIYTDNFCQTDNSLAFLLRLMIFADYFMMGSLSEVCQKQLVKFVQPQSVLDLFLVSHAHNSFKLEQYCLNFIVVNLQSVKKGIHWMDFVRRCKFQGRTCLLEKLETMILQCYQKNIVSVNLLRQLQMAQKFSWSKYQFEQEQQAQFLHKGNQDLQQNLLSMRQVIQDSQHFDEFTPHDHNPSDGAIKAKEDENTTQLTYTTKVKLPSITRIINLAVKTSSKITTKDCVASNQSTQQDQQVIFGQNNPQKNELDIEEILNVSSYIFVEKCEPIQIEAERYQHLNQFKSNRQQIHLKQALLGGELRQPLTTLSNMLQTNSQEVMKKVNGGPAQQKSESRGPLQINAPNGQAIDLKNQNLENLNPFLNNAHDFGSKPQTQKQSLTNIERPFQPFQQNRQEQITMINTCQDRQAYPPSSQLTLDQGRRSQGLENEFVFKENQNDKNVLQNNQRAGVGLDHSQNSKMDDLSQIPEDTVFGMSASDHKIVTTFEQDANQQNGSEQLQANQGQRIWNLDTSPQEQQPIQFQQFQNLYPNGDPKT